MPPSCQPVVKKLSGRKSPNQQTDKWSSAAAGQKLQAGNDTVIKLLMIVPIEKGRNGRCRKCNRGANGNLEAEG